MTIATQTLTANETVPAGPGLAELVSPAVLLRAGLVGLVLGSVLTLANQFDALFGGGTLELLPLGLVYATPFVVVTLSQVLGMRRAVLDARRRPLTDLRSGSLLTTAMSRGIPLRALLLGLIAGSVNTSVSAAASYAEYGNLSALPAALIGQAFVLPVLFGLLSQAISYRRAANTLNAPEEA